MAEVSLRCLKLILTDGRPLVFIVHQFVLVKVPRTWCPLPRPFPKHTNDSREGGPRAQQQLRGTCAGLLCDCREQPNAQINERTLRPLIKHRTSDSRSPRICPTGRDRGALLRSGRRADRPPELDRCSTHLSTSCAPRWCAGLPSFGFRVKDFGT